MARIADAIVRIDRTPNGSVRHTAYLGGDAFAWYVEGDDTGPWDSVESFHAWLRWVLS